MDEKTIAGKTTWRITSLIRSVCRLMCDCRWIVRRRCNWHGSADAKLTHAKLELRLKAQLVSEAVRCRSPFLCNAQFAASAAADECRSLQRFRHDMQELQSLEKAERGCQRAVDVRFLLAPCGEHT